MLRKTILVVDDEPRSREGVKKTIEKSAIGAFDVLTANDAKEAIQLIEKHKINLLITDIRMPEMTGLELLKVLKENQDDPVVIIMSAYSEFEYAHQALQLGVVNYLLKPISKEKLMEAIEKAINVDNQKLQTDLLQEIADDKLIEINEVGRFSGVIKEVITYIEAHFYEEISLKDVANYVHLNASYLSALFKEQLDLTFSDYVTRRRVQEAKKLLLTTDFTITEIAEKVGYNTPKYFIKIFKQAEEITPHVYRKKYESDF
ncbi:response regulator transcription factor [Saliterribacillus persicus]|uniref:AraC family two component transcriptional regulator n=1 Tax=Saliterribacillus persicus TaxID=930114 RepID=A0A368X8G0_9BACI|nr:response regulator [Saliterribacillus persicus]RCW64251.1 AraC family two component transcriptional regulator [Saliterribacillus persicus]